MSNSLPLLGAAAGLAWMSLAARDSDGVGEAASGARGALERITGRLKEGASAATDTAREAVERIGDRLRGGPGQLAALEAWPLPVAQVRKIGSPPGWRRGRMHNGVDLHAPAGTPVIAPEPMRITGVYDGTKEAKGSPSWLAGLWVEAEGRAGRILRFMHLAKGSVVVKAGQGLETGGLVGLVADTGDSGVEDSPPHVHFEVRPAGWAGLSDKRRINPLDVLPDTKRPDLDQRLAMLRTPRQGAVA